LLAGKRTEVVFGICRNPGRHTNCTWFDSVEQLCRAVCCIVFCLFLL